MNAVANTFRVLGTEVNPADYTPFEREWVERVMTVSGLPFGYLTWLDEGVCSAYVDPRNCFGCRVYMKVYRIHVASGEMDEVILYTGRSLERWES